MNGNHLLLKSVILGVIECVVRRWLFDFPSRSLCVLSNVGL